MAAEAFRLKGILRPLKTRERREFADLTRLDNADGSGWLPTFLAVEREIAAETDSLLLKKPSAGDLAAFQNAAAAKAFAAMKKAGRPES
jgi:hypothetical protein